MISNVQQYVRTVITSRLEGAEAFDEIYNNSLSFLAYSVPGMNPSDAKSIVHREISRAIKQIEREANA